MRKGALALPGVAETRDDRGVHFSVAGTTFASLSADGGTVHLHPTEGGGEVAEDVLAADVLAVPGLDVRVVDRLLRRAWEAAAAASVRAERDPAATAARTAGLPAIGRPATRALGLAGIATLDEVATRTEAELLALHGVGPRAVRILREALAAQRRGFRSP